MKLRPNLMKISMLALLGFIAGCGSDTEENCKEECGDKQQCGDKQDCGNKQDCGDVVPDENKNLLAQPVCHNDKLDAGEACDGTLFSDNIVVNCPSGLTFDASGLICTQTCALDISKACVDKRCGNGRLNGEEACDGERFDQASVAALRCPDGMKLDASLLKCTDACTIDAESACVTDYNILFSEVVPAFDGDTFSGLALEMTYLGDRPIGVGTCDLFMSSEDGAKQYVWKLSDLGISQLGAKDPEVICLQKDGFDGYGGACDTSAVENNILDIVVGSSVLALRCDGNYVDIFNLNSFKLAVNRSGIDFIRHCDASPVTEFANAILGEGWTIEPENEAAPSYGLGDHCSTDGLKVAWCNYTADKTELTSRDQSIGLTLDVRIPGQTDLSPGTDASVAFKIAFVTGEFKNDGSISHTVHHMPVVVPDSTWTNSEGIDRYVGVHRNWDDYEGFLRNEVGSYVLDAGISFDNGKTWTYCGPKGIIRDHTAYIAEERNHLSVSYKTSTCGDGILEADEVCESGAFVPQLLSCPDGKVADVSKAKCYNCTMTNLADLDICVAMPDHCGNHALDGDEACDGDAFDHETLAKGCRSDETYVPGRATCTPMCQAKVGAACVPKAYNVVMDAYLASSDTDGTRSMALTIRNQTDEDMPLTACGFALADKDGKWLNYYGLNEIAGEDAEVFSKCKPLVLCSEATWNKETHTQVFSNDLCDATLGIPLGSTAAGGYATLLDTEKVAFVQISCNGKIVDAINLNSVRSMLLEGYTHGVLKDEDRLPWPDWASVRLNDRMSLDKTFDTASFAKDVCE